jgi:hypothetical protein
LRIRSESLDSAMGSLDAIAASLVLTFNAQHGGSARTSTGLNAKSPTGSGFACRISSPLQRPHGRGGLGLGHQKLGEPAGRRGSASGNFAVN